MRWATLEIAAIVLSGYTCAALAAWLTKPVALPSTITAPVMATAPGVMKVHTPSLACMNSAPHINSFYN